MTSEHCTATDESKCLIHGDVMPLSLISYETAKREVELLRRRMQQVRDALTLDLLRAEMTAAEVVVDASDVGLRQLYAARDAARDANGSSRFWLEARINTARDYRDAALTTQATGYYAGLDAPTLKDAARLFSNTGVKVEPVSGSTVVVKVPAEMVAGVPKAVAHLSDLQDRNDSKALIALREQIGQHLIAERRYTLARALPEIYEWGYTVEDDSDGLLLVKDPRGTQVLAVRFEENGLTAHFTTGPQVQTVTSIPQFRTMLHSMSAGR